MFIDVTSYSLSIILIINIILTFVIIFLERKNPQSTYAWLLFLWVIPTAGFIFYLLFSQNLARRKIFRIFKGENEEYTELLNQQKKDLVEDKIIFKNRDREKYKDLIYFHQNISSSLYTNNNELTVYTDGKKKFNELLKCIKEAKNHIHIQYFIIKRDGLGQKIINALAEKAKEGLEVRLLFDDMGGRQIRYVDIKPIVDAGGKTAKFFPSTLKIINLKANYRNHRKLVIIDGKIGFIGGFNIGNEYLGKKKNLGYWRDTHLKITGGAVYELQMRFILDWRTASKENLRFTYKYLPEIYTRGKAGIQIVSCGPDDINEQIKQGYIKMINSAKKYIYIQTPYFVPDQSIMEALKIAALSGVDVRIMIPNKPDHLFVYWATYSNIGELLKYDIKSYTYENGFLHAKTIVVDDQISSVGTTNFDIRSFSLNFEVNAFIYDFKTSTTLKRVYEEDIKLCEQITLDRYSKRSLIIRLKESISRLFSPIL